MIIHAKVEHMAEADILSMIDGDTLARIRATDPNPEIRAYVIAHEGEAVGNLVGIGRKAIQYFRDAVVQIYDRMKLGTKIFHRHGVSNSHDGRAEIGELVGKKVQHIRGVLHDVAAVYVKPEHRSAGYDIASIEAEIQFTDDGGGHMTAVEVGDITGIALSSSLVEKPGFPGATLLAAVQAFAGEGNGVVELSEIIKAVKDGGHKPSEVFDEDALKGDSAVNAIVRKEKQTEYEHAKRVEGKLEEERKEREALEKAHEGELVKLRKESLLSKTTSVFDTLASDRKLDDKVKTFAAGNLERFTSEATSEEGLKADLNKYVDIQVAEFDRVAALFGVKKDDATADGGTGPGDGGEGAPDLMDPKQNDLIP